MEDRELLELAAKASGLQVIGWVGDKLKYFDPSTGMNGTDWNPIEDDGDALRLAMKLLMDVDIALTVVKVNWVAPIKDDCRERVYLGVDVPVYTLGYEAATRRAIVKAAVEIGGKMV